MPPKHLEEQLIAYIDNQLDVDEITAIEQELKQDAQLRGLLSMLLRQRLMLAQKYHLKNTGVHNQNQIQEEVRTVTKRTVRVRNHSRRKTSGKRPQKARSQSAIYIYAAAAMLLAVIAYLFIDSSPTYNNTEQLAVDHKETPDYVDGLPIISSQSGQIQWSQTRKDGEQLSSGESVFMHDGDNLVLHYTDGSVLKFHNSNNFTIKNNKHIAMARGNLTAEVTKQTEGSTLSVASQFGTTKVIGTQFNVLVNEDVMITSVNEGIVQVTHRTSKQTFTIGKHQEVAITANVTEQFKIGTIVDISNDRRKGFVTIEHNGKEIRYIPEWKRTGPDREILEKMESFKPKQRVKIQWHDDKEHLRILDIELVE